jgi:predicted transcriptional regulator
MYAPTMIRVEQATHKKLRALASRTGETMPQLVAAAVEEFEPKLFWEQVNQEFTALRADPKAWKQELEERAAWDTTLSDGLEH